MTDTLQITHNRTGEALGSTELPDVPQGTPNGAALYLRVLVLERTATGYRIALPQSPDKSVFVTSLSKFKGGDLPAFIGIDPVASMWDGQRRDVFELRIQVWLYNRVRAQLARDKQGSSEDEARELA